MLCWLAIAVGSALLLAALADLMTPVPDIRMEATHAAYQRRLVYERERGERFARYAAAWEAASGPRKAGYFKSANVR